jgi:hypothetical protein
MSVLIPNPATFNAGIVNDFLVSGYCTGYGLTSVYSSSFFLNLLLPLFYF